MDLGPGLEKGHASDHWTLKLLPMNAQEPLILLPGEERIWYLPTDHELSPFGTVHSLPPESYKIVVYSAKVPVAEVPGQAIKPLLEMLDENPEPQMKDSLKSIITKSVHEKRRFIWRRDNVVICSKHVGCFTFNELAGRMQDRLNTIASFTRTPPTV